MSIYQQTKEICRHYNIHPQKSKGQNFLINENIYQKIVAAAKVKDKEILEVGPGLGFLSSYLTKSAKKVVAVELDDKLANFLQTASLSKKLKNLKIINQDILKFNPAEYFSPQIGYQVVANLPYNISSIFLRSFLSHYFPPQSLLLMLQKEVAERIMAESPNMNLLALSVQYYSKQLEIISIIKANNFWPQPEVDSALIKIDYNNKRLEQGLIDKKQIEEDKKFFQLAKIGFSAKRKMLKNNLAAALKINQSLICQFLIKIGLAENCRAQNLSINDWQKLSKLIFK